MEGSSDDEDSDNDKAKKNPRKLHPLSIIIWEWKDRDDDKPEEEDDKEEAPMKDNKFESRRGRVQDSDADPFLNDRLFVGMQLIPPDPWSCPGTWFLSWSRTFSSIGDHTNRIISLHSQQAVFDQCPDGQTKIVISPNITETSVTSPSRMLSISFTAARPLRSCSRSTTTWQTLLQSQPSGPICRRGEEAQAGLHIPSLFPSSVQQTELTYDSGDVPNHSSCPSNCYSSDPSGSFCRRSSTAVFEAKWLRFWTIKLQMLYLEYFLGFSGSRESTEALRYVQDLS